MAWLFHWKTHEFSGSDEPIMHFFDQIKTGGLADPSTLQGAILFAAVFAFFAWLVGTLLKETVQRLLAHDKHDHIDRMAVKFIAKLVRYGVYAFAFAAYAHFVPALSGLGAASLTSIGMISLIVGFAAQNTLGNLIAGISLLLYRPFKLGDRLQVTAPTGLETGIVEGLTLGYPAENRRQSPRGGPQQSHGQPDRHQPDRDRSAYNLLRVDPHQSRCRH